MVVFNTTRVTIVVFLGIAYYNFLELNVLILSTFKRPKGLYFYSFLVSTWGIAFNSTGYLLDHLQLTTNTNLHATLILVGWCSMITGQSVVLYSRLHLVMRSKKKLRAVLIMIITNAIWLHIPVILLVYGINSNNPGPYERPYSIYERIQLSVFFVQELIISALYVWETTRLLRLQRTLGNTGTVHVMTHLIYMNILVILLDVTILALQFANLFDIQTAWKPLAYSVKLKLEFSVLNRLVNLTLNGRGGNYRAGLSHSHSATGTAFEGVAMGTLKGSGHQNSTAQGADQHPHYQVHVGGEGNNNNALHHQNSSVVKTIEFKVQSHTRRKNSQTSFESDIEILGQSPTSMERGVEGGIRR